MSKVNALKGWICLMNQVSEAKIFIDIAQQKFGLTKNSSLTDLLLQKSLFNSFILAYSKCFTSSGKGRIKLEATSVFKDDHIKIHKRIITLRHEYVAHNGLSGLDEASIEIEEQDSLLKFKTFYEFSIPMNEYKDYLKALKTLEEYIVIKTSSLVKSIEQESGKTVLLNNV